MSALDRDKIKKLKRGELLGTVATAACAVVVAYFAVMFAVARVTNNNVLEIVAWATGGALLAASIAVAAYCNLRFGAALEREIKRYVVDVFVENAALMHPERNSLSFFVEINSDSAAVAVNGYKEKITFDFSAFGKLGASKKVTVFDIIGDTIAFTFCKLYERGGEYKSVEYKISDSRKKKAVPVISDGVPDQKTFKRYLKNR